MKASATDMPPRHWILGCDFFKQSSGNKGWNLESKEGRELELSPLHKTKSCSACEKGTRKLFHAPGIQE